MSYKLLRFEVYFFMEKKQKKQHQYSVEFKLCAILDKLENGLNYIDVGIIAPPQ